MECLTVEFRETHALPAEVAGDLGVHPAHVRVGPVPHLEEDLFSEVTEQADHDLARREVVFVLLAC